MPVFRKGPLELAPFAPASGEFVCGGQQGQARDRRRRSSAERAHLLPSRRRRYRDRATEQPRE